MLPALLRASRKSPSDKASPCNKMLWVQAVWDSRSRCKDGHSPAAASPQMCWKRCGPAKEQQSSRILLQVK